MVARILDGRARALALREALATRVKSLREQGLTPCLAVLIVGEDSASKVYVKNKVAACEAAGIRSLHVALPADASQQQVLAQVTAWNADPAVHGVLVQLPLPPHLDSKQVLAAIAVQKDVDGFHAQNTGLLSQGDERALVACTPRGVMDLLRHDGVALEGAEAVVLGRSNIVGKPMAMLLTNAGATVTVCHSKTQDLAAHTRRAQILVAAVGRAGMVGADMVRAGAVVIDVGINRQADGRLVGDVDFDGVRAVAGAITPVPGGVGPMTIAMLLENTVEAAVRQQAGDR